MGKILFTFRLIVIGGNLHSGYIEEDEITGDKLGITKWRILSDYPFYKKDLGESSVSKVRIRSEFNYCDAKTANERYRCSSLHFDLISISDPFNLKTLSSVFNFHCVFFL